ncbi:exocyst complex component 3-like protein 4 [Austrofundulus limnaeus]|uniref:Exocyst complex component 3-like protein 4 n=1 Tax=Austrofundulus limnaeus TaxID=52670 RepID=A0A2I4CC77_AUSLI|nr:PREDICTED: exocyst complex component 3-like protein 4 [Austrofundulus limnaeus]
MSLTMDKSGEGPEEDGVSLRSDGKTSPNGSVREASGLLRSFRRSFRRTPDKSPASARSKGSKVTSREEPAGEEEFFLSPPSPSPSSSSLVSSPLKTIGGVFNKKEEDSPDVVPHKHKPLSRSKTDPNMSKLGESFIKKGASIRRSLRFGSKKENEKTNRPEVLLTTSEGLVEKMEEEVEEELEEMEEVYNLPDIPHTPLSVMQINKLIEMEVLEEAHLNLLALRLEFQKEQDRFDQDCPMELSKKEKDLNLLYMDLRTKIGTIVRDSNSLPARNKPLLVFVARIIQEEEKRSAEPGGLPDSWMEAWREAVCEGVQVKVNSVHLEHRDKNPSWLAVHLGLLGNAIVEDLQNVKRDLRWSYPPSFRVFSSYVRSYHRVVRQHLKKLEPQVTDLKDLFALLDWILNKYKSEKIMMSLSLQPDMTEENADLQLEENFLQQLKDKYCCKVKEDMKITLERIIELENETFWRDRKEPEKEETFLISPFPMDIWTKVKGTVQNSRKLESEVEQKVISSCIEELKSFPRRFESQFRSQCGALQPRPLWTQYQITYINSFAALLDHMDGYQDSCPNEVEGFRREVKWLIVRLMQSLEDQFKEDIKVYLRRMMTRKWLTNDEDFNHLRSRTQKLSQDCDLMRPPQAQDFASQLHHHVAKEYIGHLMRSNYSCRNRKHEKAAAKIRRQWSELSDLFEEMKSTQEWLHPAGDDLSNIIGQKNKTDIKNHLQRLVQHYPDFSRKHLVALLYFRGLQRGHEHQVILQRLAVLKKETGVADGNRSHVLFGDMQVTTNTDCLSSLPSSCLSLLRDS